MKNEQMTLVTQGDESPTTFVETAFTNGEIDHAIATEKLLGVEANACAFLDTGADTLTMREAATVQ